MVIWLLKLRSQAKLSLEPCTWCNCDVATEKINLFKADFCSDHLNQQPQSGHLQSSQLLTKETLRNKGPLIIDLVQLKNVTNLCYYPDAFSTQLPFLD